MFVSPRFLKDLFALRASIEASTMNALWVRPDYRSIRQRAPRTYRATRYVPKKPVTEADFAMVAAAEAKRARQRARNLRLVAAGGLRGA